MQNLDKLYSQVQTLIFFAKLKNNPMFQYFHGMMRLQNKSENEDLQNYSAFMEGIFEAQCSWSRYLLELILICPNIIVKKTAQQKGISDKEKANLRRELKILEKISRIEFADLFQSAGDFEGLPSWETETLNFSEHYDHRMDKLEKYGFGKFALHHMFKVSGDSIVPVERPDPVLLDDLKGYHAERQTVLENTIALLNHQPAANVLLYGDAGTGKSSTIKAIVNSLKDQGLRLIEIGKNELACLPSILNEIEGQPLKFILFVDDLTFSKDHDELGALKGILEGSVFARSKNSVFYATSNRRHMVKSLFSDRDGDDIHPNETIQEEISLSDRFGLTIGFYRPNAKEYMMLLKLMMEAEGLSMADELLAVKAERFALQRNGRSPRTARQFIDMLHRQHNEQDPVSK